MAYTASDATALIFRTEGGEAVVYQMGRARVITKANTPMKMEIMHNGVWMGWAYIPADIEAKLCAELVKNARHAVTL